MRGHQSASSRLKSTEAILPDSFDMVPSTNQMWQDLTRGIAGTRCNFCCVPEQLRGTFDLTASSRSLRSPGVGLVKPQEPAAHCELHAIRVGPRMNLNGYSVPKPASMLRIGSEISQRDTHVSQWLQDYHRDPFPHSLLRTREMKEVSVGSFSNLTADLDLEDLPECKGTLLQKAVGSDEWQCDALSGDRSSDAEEKCENLS
ncbi:hypothetical protein AK812_SmicGene32564 [Symbiodinium microadriaticum]|uniref:Uncharacterized protein n=1 Tax=Symbiodinium microadriaticum TaxID=2951 RepID=A0A1Q9CTT1_SYMMI|nr:hypothetical protein AK812_SmicGene32564 [Symbiodinium microadriaticum]CAE7946026.1 unnamed protein product [Symbiodinium sp. KB8]